MITTRLTPCVFFTVGFFIVYFSYLVILTLFKKTQAYKVQQNRVLFNFIADELGL